MAASMVSTDKVPTTSSNMSGLPLYHLRRIGPPSTKPDVADIMDLDKVTSLIGRNHNQVDFLLDSSNAIASQYISRLHARIVRQQNNAHRLYDDSLNGIFINSTKISGSVILQEGDVVTFGHPQGAKLAPGVWKRQPDSEYQFIFELCSCKSHLTKLRKRPSSVLEDKGNTLQTMPSKKHSPSKFAKDSQGTDSLDSSLVIESATHILTKCISAVSGLAERLSTTTSSKIVHSVASKTATGNSSVSLEKSGNRSFNTKTSISTKPIEQANCLQHSDVANYVSSTFEQCSPINLQDQKRITDFFNTPVPKRQKINNTTLVADETLVANISLSEISFQDQSICDVETKNQDLRCVLNQNVCETADVQAEAASAVSNIKAFCSGDVSDEGIENTIADHSKDSQIKGIGDGKNIIPDKEAASIAAESFPVETSLPAIEMSVLPSQQSNPVLSACEPKTMSELISDPGRTPPVSENTALLQTAKEPKLLNFASNETEMPQSFKEKTSESKPDTGETRIIWNISEKSLMLQPATKETDQMQIASEGIEQLPSEPTSPENVRKKVIQGICEDFEDDAGDSQIDLQAVIGGLDSQPDVDEKEKTISDELKTNSDVFSKKNLSEENLQICTFTQDTVLKMQEFGAYTVSTAMKEETDVNTTCEENVPKELQEATNITSNKTTVTERGVDEEKNTEGDVFTGEIVEGDVFTGEIVETDGTLKENIDKQEINTEVGEIESLVDNLQSREIILTEPNKKPDGKVCENKNLSDASQDSATTSFSINNVKYEMSEIESFPGGILESDFQIDLTYESDEDGEQNEFERFSVQSETEADQKDGECAEYEQQRDGKSERENITAGPETITADAENKTAGPENRTAETEKKAVETENRTAETENKTADTENKTADTENKTADTENKTADTENKTADTENRIAETEKKTADTENRIAETEKKTVDTENRIAETENKTAETENKTAETENKTVETENKTAETENKTAETENKTKDAEEISISVTDGGEDSMCEMEVTLEIDQEKQSNRENYQESETDQGNVGEITVLLNGEEHRTPGSEENIAVAHVAQTTPVKKVQENIAALDDEVERTIVTEENVSSLALLSKERVCAKDMTSEMIHENLSLLSNQELHEKAEVKMNIVALDGEENRTKVTEQDSSLVALVEKERLCGTDLIFKRKQENLSNQVDQRTDPIHEMEIEKSDAAKSVCSMTEKETETLCKELDLTYKEERKRLRMSQNAEIRSREGNYVSQKVKNKDNYDSKLVGKRILEDNRDCVDNEPALKSKQQTKQHHKALKSYTIDTYLKSEMSKKEDQNVAIDVGSEIDEDIFQLVRNNYSFAGEPNFESGRVNKAKEAVKTVSKIDEDIFQLVQNNNSYAGEPNSESGRVNEAKEAVKTVSKIDEDIFQLVRNNYSFVSGISSEKERVNDLQKATSTVLEIDPEVFQLVKSNYICVNGKSIESCWASEAEEADISTVDPDVLKVVKENYCYDHETSSEEDVSTEQMLDKKADWGRDPEVCDFIGNNYRCKNNAGNETGVDVDKHMLIINADLEIDQEVFNIVRSNYCYDDKKRKEIDEASEQMLAFNTDFEIDEDVLNVVQNNYIYSDAVNDYGMGVNEQNPASVVDPEKSEIVRHSYNCKHEANVSSNVGDKVFEVKKNGGKCSEGSIVKQKNVRISELSGNEIESAENIDSLPYENTEIFTTSTPIEIDNENLDNQAVLNIDISPVFVGGRGLYRTNAMCEAPTIVQGHDQSSEEIINETSYPDLTGVLETIIMDNTVTEDITIPLGTIDKDELPVREQRSPADETMLYNIQPQGEDKKCVSDVPSVVTERKVLSKEMQVEIYGNKTESCYKELSAEKTQELHPVSDSLSRTLAPNNQTLDTNTESSTPALDATVAFDILSSQDLFSQTSVAYCSKDKDLELDVSYKKKVEIEMGEQQYDVSSQCQKDKTDISNLHHQHETSPVHGSESFCEPSHISNLDAQNTLRSCWDVSKDGDSFQTVGMSVDEEKLEAELGSQAVSQIQASIPADSDFEIIDCAGDRIYELSKKKDCTNFVVTESHQTKDTNSFTFTEEIIDVQSSSSVPGKNLEELQTSLPKHTFLKELGLVPTQFVKDHLLSSFTRTKSNNLRTEASSSEPVMAHELCDKLPRETAIAEGTDQKQNSPGLKNNLLTSDVEEVSHVSDVLKGFLPEEELVFKSPLYISSTLKHIDVKKGLGSESSSSEKGCESPNEKLHGSDNETSQGHGEPPSSQLSDFLEDDDYKLIWSQANNSGSMDVSTVSEEEDWSLFLADTPTAIKKSELPEITSCHQPSTLEQTKPQIANDISKVGISSQNSLSEETCTHQVESSLLDNTVIEAKEDEIETQKTDLKSNYVQTDTFESKECDGLSCEIENSNDDSRNEQTASPHDKICHVSEYLHNIRNTVNNFEKSEIMLQSGEQSEPVDDHLDQENEVFEMEASEQKEDNFINTGSKQNLTILEQKESTDYYLLQDAQRKEDGIDQENVEPSSGISKHSEEKITRSYDNALSFRLGQKRCSDRSLEYMEKRKKYDGCGSCEKMPCKVSQDSDTNLVSTHQTFISSADQSNNMYLDRNLPIKKRKWSQDLDDHSKAINYNKKVVEESMSAIIVDSQPTVLQIKKVVAEELANTQELLHLTSESSQEKDVKTFHQNACMESSPSAECKDSPNDTSVMVTKSSSAQNLATSLSVSELKENAQVSSSHEKIDSSSLSAMKDSMINPSKVSKSENLCKNMSLESAMLSSEIQSSTLPSTNKHGHVSTKIKENTKDPFSVEPSQSMSNIRVGSPLPSTPPWASTSLGIELRTEEQLPSSPPAKGFTSRVRRREQLHMAVLSELQRLDDDLKECLAEPGTTDEEQLLATLEDLDTLPINSSVLQRYPNVIETLAQSLSITWELEQISQLGSKVLQRFRDLFGSFRDQY